jgi:hypothetical protein
MLAMGDQSLVQLTGEHRVQFTPAWCMNQWQVMQTMRLRAFTSTSLSR